jgi:23S rRNA maturation mini-RNase III
MDTGYLDRLADQLKVNKTAACRRAINRMLAEMKKRCNAGEYRNQTEAETPLGSSLKINTLARSNQASRKRSESSLGGTKAALSR